MLTILGEKHKQRFCDGLRRRDFIRIGSLALGGLALPDILRAEEKAGIRKSHKAIIMVYLAGGPPHLDMWDLKPEAPAEIRGEFKPIKTNVEGIEICEVFPRLAKIMDKCVIIRSLVGARDEHTSHICLSGYSYAEFRQNNMPSIGAVLSRLYGPVDKSVPPFVGLAAKTQHMPWSNSGEAGFLGPAHAPVKPESEIMKDMVLSGITLGRLKDRRQLLASLDRFRRFIDKSAVLESMDAYQQRAFDVLTSSKLFEALDISKEEPKVRERYGDGKPYNYQYDGAPTANDHLLIARRLVEAGVRCVTLSYGRWDSHGQNFPFVRDHGSKLDQALSALIEDLDQRGMLKDVTVVAWGEFGRTPRINKDAGRDHWPQVSCALLAGGGMRTGQVIGSTNRFGEYAEDRPVHYQDVFATLYHNLGIDIKETPVPDSIGRPHYLYDGQREPIKELI